MEFNPIHFKPLVIKLIWGSPRMEALLRERFYIMERLNFSPRVLFEYYIHSIWFQDLLIKKYRES